MLVILGLIILPELNLGIMDTTTPHFLLMQIRFGSFIIVLEKLDTPSTFLHPAGTQVDKNIYIFF